MAEPLSEGTEEKGVSKPKAEILKEAERIEEATLYSSRRHYVSAQMWSVMHILLGLPATVLAAVVAGFAFNKTDKPMWAIICSIAVAALSALTTFLNPTKRTADHSKAGNGYDALNNKTRIFRTIDCWLNQTDAALTKRLKELSEEKDKLNKESPQCFPGAYWLAKRGIKAGEAAFAVDERTQHDLPA